MEKVKIKSYQDLLVWQKAHALVRKILRECKGFPRTDEAREIKRQLIRAGTSVPANIAEGYGGSQGQAYRNYLTIARRSANETDYWILLSEEEQYLSKTKSEEFRKDCAESILMLTSIIDKLS